jgi:hypothetical protein
MYASFLGISSRSKACGMDIFHQPLRSRFIDSLEIRSELKWAKVEVLAFGEPHSKTDKNLIQFRHFRHFGTL